MLHYTTYFLINGDYRCCTHFLQYIVEAVYGLKAMCLCLLPTVGNGMKRCFLWRNWICFVEWYIKAIKVRTFAR